MAVRPVAGESGDRREPTDLDIRLDLRTAAAQDFQDEADEAGPGIPHVDEQRRVRGINAERARSKSRHLERLEVEEVAAAEPTAAIRCPVVSPRREPAVRCRGLSIGHGDRVVAAGIDVEVVHGTRAAIVGDNGQGKTTFLRTLVASLPPLAGEVRWGHGCELGVYAQHVYTSLPAEETVIGHLERGAAIGTPGQRILDLAGAMLFRGRAVEKRIAVLSGGERARLCLAGLLLGSANVLILDESGNHLDVETVDALAAALVDYSGTVIFTSHDRSFVQAVATDVIEVGEGRRPSPLAPGQAPAQSPELQHFAQIWWLAPFPVLRGISWHWPVVSWASVPYRP